MYQPCTIRGSGGFSKLNDGTTDGYTTSGALVCMGGSGWARLLATATVEESGANAEVTDPNDDPFTDGWIYLKEGASFSFGTEQVRSNAGMNTVVDPVAQIDVFSDNADFILVIQQH